MFILTNYTKIAFRQLWKNRFVTIINVAGLSLAITCLLLAVLYTLHERSFDRFHSKKENLYRVLTTFTNQQGERKTVAGTGQPQAPAFKEAVPEIEEYVRVLGGDITTHIYANEKTIKLRTLFADEKFFDLFTFPVLRGNPGTALNDISSAVVTESVARKFFNSIDVVGKTLNLDSDPSAAILKKPMVISAVVKDLPQQSSIQFDVLMPLRFMQLSFTDDNWLNQYLGSFLLLKPGADKEKVIRKFNQVYTLHANQQVEQSVKTYHYDPKIEYGLQPIAEMHLNPLPTGTGWREGGIVNESSPVFSYLFIGISLFIFLMAAINFINISIAGSLKRAKEIGVRKITGGNRLQIVSQFLFESAIVCAISFLLALLILNNVLPLFNDLTNKQLEPANLAGVNIVLLSVGILFFIILAAGFYPALTLSSFKAKEVLYNKQTFSGNNLTGRLLVIVQFSLSVFFMVATIVYYQQMNFIRTKDLGYDPQQVLVTYIPGDRDVVKIKSQLQQVLANEPSIEQISFGGSGSVYDVSVNGKVVPAQHEVVDENRLPVLGIRLKAGRNISPDFSSDKKHAVLVNEAFVRAAGLESPIGTQLRTSDYYDKEEKTIVGVVEDYHVGSLREPIKPMVMVYSEWASGGIWVKLSKKQQQKAIAALSAAFKKVMPTALFEYNFLDEMNAREYVQEQRWQKIITAATLLSIVICMLGLLGLAAMAANRRRKEIGIRKVLGASVMSIGFLLTKSFVRLVLVAFLVASPVAWWVMNSWLQNFAYRVNISINVFAITLLLSVLIACAAVLFNSIKAAWANPVKSLRTE